MSSLRFLLFLSFQVLAVLGLGHNQLINLPELDEDQLNWPQQKIQTVEYLLNTLLEVGNVTLVGWQQIWNSDGTLKEIRTIELTILNNTAQELLDEVEGELLEELPIVLDVMHTLTSSTGIFLSGSVQKWDWDGTIDESLIVDPNSSLIKVKDQNLMYWQQNITVTNPTTIQNLVTTLKQQSIVPVAVLEWNVDGTLNLQSSVIVPELLATITSVEAENVTIDMLESAFVGTAKGVLLQPDLVPTYVANYMKQNIPGYFWIAAEDLSGSWVKPGVQMSIEYEWVDIGLSPINVDVIGIEI